MMPLAPSKRCRLVVILFAVAMAGRGCERALHPSRRRSNRPVSAESVACRWCAGRGRARASVDAHHAVDGRYPGRTRLARAAGLQCTRIRRVGHSLLCVSPSDVRMADIRSTGTLFYRRYPGGAFVLAPVSIALLMVVWGTSSHSRVIYRRVVFPIRYCGLGGLGIVLALYVFMADAIQSLPLGHEATRQVLPTAFNWPLFSLALAPAAAPVVALGRRGRSSPGVPARSVARLHDVSNPVD